VQLGSADVSSFVAWRKKYNVCEQANFSIVMGGNGSYHCPSVAQLVTSPTSQKNILLGKTLHIIHKESLH
jgi:hypothetical protein